MSKIERKAGQQERTYPNLDTTEEKMQPPPYSPYPSAPPLSYPPGIPQQPVPQPQPQPVPHQGYQQYAPVFPAERREVEESRGRHDSMPSGLLFLMGFICCPLWPIGASLYLRSHNRLAKTFAIGSLLMTLLAVWIILKILSLF